MDEGCTCHVNPPCPFCCELNEYEADIYATQGLEALRHYRSVIDTRMMLVELVNPTLYNLYAKSQGDRHGHDD